MIDTAKQDNSWEIVLIFQSILLTVPSSILVTPPKTELICPNNISVLIEKKGKSNFALLSVFNRFVAYDNIFINFVFLLKTKK